MKRSCEHPIASHVHGTYACYTLDRCHCDECRAANAAYEQSRILWLAGVTPHPLVPAGPVRQHVRQLMDQGMGLKRIAAVSGISHGSLWKLMYGKDQVPSRGVRRETAETLLALDLDLADGAKVPAKEAWLIVNELVERGWSKAAIGREVHGPHAKSLQLSRRQVHAGHIRTLRKLLDAPVPYRVHAPTGRRYRPTGRAPRPVPAQTLGLPADTGPAMAGRLTCRVCGRPYAEHRISERCGTT